MGVWDSHFVLCMGERFLFRVFGICSGFWGVDRLLLIPLFSLEASRYRRRYDGGL
jgi:hypothetical protein